MSKKHGFEVHILDREWLCNRVINFNRDRIAIETLGITVSQQPNVEKGPKDTERQQELDELLCKLREPMTNYASDIGIASAYLQAGFLARELERPRHETEAFFRRARSLAVTCQDKPLEIHCAYHHAWTDNWWFDDVTTAIQAYDDFERFVESAPDAHSVEKFCNLLTLMWTAVLRDEYNPEQLRLRERELAVKRRLYNLVNDHPDEAVRLQAETMLAFREFFPWLRDDAFDVDEILRKLSSCFVRSRSLVSYPLTRFTDTVVGLSEYFVESREFDSIFDLIQSLTSERDGEIAEARLLISKGNALQKAGKLRHAAAAFQQARVKAAKQKAWKRV